MTTTKTTTIPPWTRLECSECGMDNEATRTEPKTITGPFVCSDCKLSDQALATGEEAAYERIAAWYKAGCPVDRDWALAREESIHLVADYIAAGLPGWCKP